MIVYTGGTFDGLHVGHLELLAGCRSLAGPRGRVVVALNRDEFISRFKGRIPLHPYEHRRELLEACRDVDVVVCNTGDEDSTVAIAVVQPNVIAIGDDWKDRDYLGQLGVTQAWLDERGIQVIYLERTRGVSTTALLEQAKTR